MRSLGHRTPAGGPSPGYGDAEVKVAGSDRPLCGTSGKEVRT